MSTTAATITSTSSWDDLAPGIPRCASLAAFPSPRQRSHASVASLAIKRRPVVLGPTPDEKSSPEVARLSRQRRRAIVSRVAKWISQPNVIGFPIRLVGKSRRQPALSRPTRHANGKMGQNLANIGRYGLRDADAPLPREVAIAAMAWALLLTTADIQTRSMPSMKPLLNLTSKQRIAHFGHYVEEQLVADTRESLSPSQCVDAKLRELLRCGSTSSHPRPRIVPIAGDCQLFRVR